MESNGIQFLTYGYIGVFFGLIWLINKFLRFRLYVPLIILFIGFIIVIKLLVEIFPNALRINLKFLLGTSLPKQTIPPFELDKGTEFLTISPISIILYLSSDGR